MTPWPGIPKNCMTFSNILPFKVNFMTLNGSDFHLFFHFYCFIARLLLQLEFWNILGGNREPLPGIKKKITSNFSPSPHSQLKLGS